jgi:hypothetical protein
MTIQTLEMVKIFSLSVISVTDISPPAYYKSDTASNGGDNVDD